MYSGWSTHKISHCHENFQERKTATLLQIYPRMTFTDPFLVHIMMCLKLQSHDPSGYKSSNLINDGPFAENESEKHQK